MLGSIRIQKQAAMHWQLDDGRATELCQKFLTEYNLQTTETDSNNNFSTSVWGNMETSEGIVNYFVLEVSKNLKV